MKVLAIVSFLCGNFIISEALKCDRLECPKETTTCSINFLIKDSLKVKYTNVTCYDFNDAKVLHDSYETVLDDFFVQVPIIECGGHKCKPGSFSCISILKTAFENNHFNETVQLTCRDAKGEIIEELIMENEIEPKLEIELPPLVCEGYTCPNGSHKCKFDTTIVLEPYKKTTVVTCYDIKNTKLIQTTI